MTAFSCRFESAKLRVWVVLEQSEQMVMRSVSIISCIPNLSIKTPLTTRNVIKLLQVQLLGRWEK